MTRSLQKDSLGPQPSLLILIEPAGIFLIEYCTSDTPSMVALSSGIPIRYGISPRFIFFIPDVQVFILNGPKPNDTKAGLIIHISHLPLVIRTARRAGSAT